MIVEPSPIIGRKSEEYSLIALISGEAQEALRPIREALAREFPTDIYVYQGSQLHITVSAIIRDITYGDETRDVFLAGKSDIIQKIRRVLDEYRSISIRFNQFEVADRAVIIKGQDPSVLNSIRATLISELSIPYPSSTYAHTSIARYKTALSSEIIADSLVRFEIDFIESISEFVLVRELIMPLQKYEIMERFPLRD